MAKKTLSAEHIASMQKARAEARERQMKQDDELRAQGIEPDVTLRAVTGNDADGPLKSMRKMCLDCVGGSYREVELCPDPKCPLWHFRFGMRPETARAEGRLVDRAKFTGPVRDEGEDLGPITRKRAKKGGGNDD